MPTETIMIPDFAIPALIIFDVLIWLLSSKVAKKQTSQRKSAAISALGGTVIFSPGVLIGHGVVLFPAVPAIIFQPLSTPLNFMSAGATFLILFAANRHLLQINIKRKKRTSLR
jgi:hypothetical protein